MKKLLLFGSALMAGISFSQTTIYQENFETGNSFTLNTTDLGGASTFNTWLVNNAYTGGSGTFICLGFPFSFTVPNTPAQPGGIAGAPSSNYMHIAAQAAISNGINCASYIPADGTCVTAESNFTKMTSPISTSGFSNVTIDFWWMCAGSTTGFGELYYSLDGGSTWTLKQSNFNNVTNWSQTAISDPLWDNQASLLFAFRFVNNTASTAADPSFSIDEILVTGMTSTTAITTTDVQPLTSWCFGSATTLQVSFDATGVYNAGNVFTAQLSDASGSFASPTAVGSLTSSTSGVQMISAVIPGTTPVGSGYRIRVVASDPSTTGSDNGSDLIIHALPTVSMSPLSSACSNDPSILLTGGLPSGGTYNGITVTNNTFLPSVAGPGVHPITYVFTDSNGCSASASETLTVNAIPNVTMDSISDFCVSEAPYTLTEGSPAGGTYSGTGVTGSIFDPGTAGVGTHTINYEYTDGNGCTASEFVFVYVDGCSGLTEFESANYSIFPNPTNEYFIIVSEIDFESIELKEMNGRLIRTLIPNETIDVSDLSAGVYLIELYFDGNAKTERLMIK